MRLKRSWVFVGGSLLMVFYFGFVGDFNLYQLWKLNRRRDELSAEIDKNKQIQRQLSREIELLQSDSTYIEKVAREKFRMGRKGERIYLTEAEDNP